MAGRAWQAVRSWRRTDTMRIPGDPADVDSAIHVPMMAGTSGREMRPAEQLAAVAALIAAPCGEEPWRCATAKKR